MSGEQKIGLYGKYVITRTDGTSAPGQKHEKCRYFALDLVHDPFAKPAILAYAKACEKTHAVLAQDLREVATHGTFFRGGRTTMSPRCIGPGRPTQGRCGRRYLGQKGWDFVQIRPLEGWVCGDCRFRFWGAFGGPGLDKTPTKKRKHDFKRAAAQNAKAFGSTKSKDGMFPI